jgi:hypothetical protein
VLNSCHRYHIIVNLDIYRSQWIRGEVAFKIVRISITSKLDFNFILHPFFVLNTTQFETQQKII